MARTSGMIEPAALESVSTQDLYRELLMRMGEDPNRDGLLRTPGRMEKALKFLTRGYTMDVTEVLHDALFDVDYDEMVIVKDMEFYSRGEQRRLPVLVKQHERDFRTGE